MLHKPLIQCVHFNSRRLTHVRAFPLAFNAICRVSHMGLLTDFLGQRCQLVLKKGNRNPYAMYSVSKLSPSKQLCNNLLYYNNNQGLGLTPYIIICHKFVSGRIYIQISLFLWFQTSSFLKASISLSEKSRRSLT